MKRVLHIDSERAWGQLVLGHVCEDITSNPDRLALVKGGDLLIIHTSEGMKNDRAALRKLTQQKQDKPTLVLVTMGLVKELSDEWIELAAEYGTAILDRVLYFKDVKALPDAELARYTAHLRQLLDETQPSGSAPHSEDHLERIKGVFGVVRPLASALRFWIDAKLSQIPSEGAGFDRTLAEHTSGVAIATSDDWKNILMPGTRGVGWEAVFSGRLPVLDEIKSLLWRWGNGAKDLEPILSPHDSLHAAKAWASSQGHQIVEGGAIRLLYEVALRQGDLDNFRAEWTELSLAVDVWEPVMWVNLLQAAQNEANTLYLQAGRTLARAEFTCARLNSNEDERSVLHHSAFRQEVLQRLISHDVSGHLSARHEDNTQPARLAELAKLLSEHVPTTLTANVQRALAAWQGNRDRNIQGVKERIYNLINVWCSPHWLAKTGLALKSDEARILDEAVKAIEWIEAVIGSDKIWQQHLASSQTKRNDRATQFWIGACLILECLRRWHAAPTRFFEFYEESEL